MTPADDVLTDRIAYCLVRVVIFFLLAAREERGGNG